MPTQLWRVHWKNDGIYYGEHRMTMEKLRTTDISTVYRCTCPDHTVVVKQFRGDDLIEYRMEVRVIRLMKRHRLNFVEAWPIARKTIVMENMDNDLGAWNGNVLAIEGIIHTLVDGLQSMIDCGLYYTDMKAQNIMYRQAADDDALEIKFGDLSACAEEGQWCSQTYPYPTVNYNKDDYDGTVLKACESVVVWGVGIVWMMLLGHLHMVIEYMSFHVQSPRSTRMFQRTIKKMNIPEKLKDILLLKYKTLKEIF